MSRKHCPFCGCKEIQLRSYKKYHQMACTNCYARGPVQHTKIGAGQSWHRRRVKAARTVSIPIIGTVS